jgi:ABC-type antimicrobial peptide transport system ATPase subunit
MSEMAEVWADLREISQKKRRSNMASSTAMLQHNEIPFVVHNSGVHLVLTKGLETIDYWPSTGLWWIRGTSNKRRGVKRLLAYMKAKAS